MIHYNQPDTGFKMKLNLALDKNSL